MKNLINNKFILGSILIYTLFIDKVICNDYYIDENGLLEIYGQCFNECYSSINTPAINIQINGQLQNGHSGNIDKHTGVLYINETGNNSKIMGNLENGSDADLLNENTLYITSKDNNKKATINTEGLFINQGTIIVGHTGKLICKKFNPLYNNIDEYKTQFYYYDEHNNIQWYDDDQKNWSESKWESEFQKYQNDPYSSQDPTRGGILNGFLHNNGNNTTKYYKYNGAYYNGCGFNEDKQYSIVPINNGDAKYGTIICIPGAIISEFSVGEINGGVIDLKNYIKLENINNTNQYNIVFDSKSSEQTDEPFNSSINDGQQLKAHLKNANIKLFEESTELNNEKILKIGTDLDGSQESKTLFYNLDFTNCYSYIPDDIGNVYTSNNQIIPYENENISLPDQNSLYKYKRACDKNYYKLNIKTQNNNFSKVSSLFKENIRGRIYNGILKDDNITLDKVYNSSNNIIYNSSDNTTIIPTDGLILKNKCILNKYSFSDLFNKYINYNCYIDLVENDESDLAYEPTKVEKNTNCLHLTLCDNNNDLNNNILHKKEIYIQLMKNKDIQISNKYQYGPSIPYSEKEYTKALQLQLNNICGIYNTENNNTTLLNSYQGNIYRQLPSAINNNNRITQIYQNYDGPAFNRYQVTFNKSNDSTKTNKSDCTNSEILQYAVLCNSSNFSTTNNDKPFVVDKFIVGNGNAQIIINPIVLNNTVNNILTQHFVINEQAKFYIRGNLTITKLKKSDFNNNSRIV